MLVELQLIAPANRYFTGSRRITSDAIRALFADSGFDF